MLTSPLSGERTSGGFSRHRRYRVPNELRLFARLTLSYVNERGQFRDINRSSSVVDDRCVDPSHC